MIRNGLVISLLSIFCAFGSSSAENYNYGIQLLYSPPTYSTFFLIHSISEEDDRTTDGNKEFLVKYFLENKNKQLSGDNFFKERTLKLLNFDSVFVTRYETSFRNHNSQFVLNDITCNKHILLNSMNINDFNEFLGCNEFKQPIDYIYLEQLYIILSNISERIYFLDSELGVIFAYDIPMPAFNLYLFTDSARTEFTNKYEDQICSPSVTDGDSTIVSQSAFNLGEREVRQYIAIFIKGRLFDINNEVIIGKSEIAKLLEK
ncbi:MAG TPA: hypothetical protein DCZ43_09070 [candidate division Zixibacteria bacterium]|jgi:hypothetical protein|nr:hypothetical protein [candidate division Zixibacteria bacterium]